MNSRNKEKRISQLLKYEHALKQMANKGQIDFPLDDELVEIIMDDLESLELSKEEKGRLSADLRIAHQNRAIEKARTILAGKRYPFGRHIQSLRLKAKLSIPETARRLSFERSYLESIEEGKVSPLSIAINSLVDMMEFFKISISEFTKIVKKHLLLAKVKTIQIKAPLARSSPMPSAKEREVKLSHALDAALLEISKKKDKLSYDSIQLNEEFVKGIEKELIKRDRRDLLK